MYHKIKSIYFISVRKVLLAIRVSLLKTRTKDVFIFCKKRGIGFLDSFAAFLAGVLLPSITSAGKW
jgi:hypothetical protein